jgi:hypothetical protein
MAIVKRPETTDQMLVLGFDNGDLQAVREVIEKFHFLDEQAALRYVLFVLLNAEKNVVYVDKGGKILVVNPNPQSLRQPQQTHEGQQAAQQQ